MKPAIGLVTAFLFASVHAQAAAPIPPTPTRWVTDHAGFLPAVTQQALEGQLATYSRTTGHQVLIWIGDTTGSEPTETWTDHAFRAWRVGRKGIDDGLVLFIFATDRKARIEVGYGLEGVVPDITASHIIQETVIPRIVAGDHAGAVNGAVDRLTMAISGSPITRSPPSSATAPKGPTTVGAAVLTILAVLVFLILFVRNPTLALYLLSLFLSGGRGGGNDGGGFSGGGGRSGGGGSTGKW